MIKVINGDLLKAQENLIVHSVNCQGVMGSGVAKQIRNKYPIVYEKYTELCNRFLYKREMLGEVQVIHVEHSKAIINLFGQFNYGKDGKLYTDYDALRKGFNSIKNFALLFDLNVAIPYEIGCGLGGGNWNFVYEMIEEIFEKCDVTLYKLEGK